LDNLTHSLFGLTLARTPLGRAGRGTTAALLLASNAPDIDIVTTAGGAIRYLEWHRGPTHGVFGIVGLGLATAALVSAGVWAMDARTQARRGGPAGPPDRRAGLQAGPYLPFLKLALVSMLGVVFHILMDLPTSYGTRPLSPFSWTWYTTDWVPIVDIYLLVILVAGLWIGRKTPARSATRALILMVAFYALRATTHHLAIARAPEVFGRAVPARCADAVPAGAILDSWPERDHRPPRDRQAEQCLVEVAAFPDVLSPFRWRLLAQLSDSYEVRQVDLLVPGEPGAARVSTRYPNQWTPAVVTAASSSDVARVFLGFSRFPSARSVRESDGTTIVRWSDMRFVAPTVRSGQRGSGLFTAVVRVAPDGAISSERLGEPLRR
jgi:inner membrane protein